MAGKGIIFVFHYFSRGGRPSSSTCCYGFVCEGEKKLSCWWTGQASLDHKMNSCLHPLLFLHPAAGFGDVCANGGPRGRSTRRSAGTNGTWTFSLYCSLSDLSGAHGCCLHGHRHLSRLPVCRTPHAANHHTHQIDFTDWITLPVLRVWGCVWVRMLVYVCVCAANMYWRTLKWSTWVTSWVNICLFSS